MLTPATTCKRFVAGSVAGLATAKDEGYAFQGGDNTPDDMKDRFRGRGSDIAVLLDGGGSSAIVLRRNTGGRWAGAGSPKGKCGTRLVLRDSHERALPTWLAFN